LNMVGADADALPGASHRPWPSHPNSCLFGLSAMFAGWLIDFRWNTMIANLILSSYLPKD
jgi:hypothetical protein